MKEWGVSKLSGRHLHVYMYFFPSTHAPLSDEHSTNASLCAFQCLNVIPLSSLDTYETLRNTAKHCKILRKQ